MAREIERKFLIDLPACPIPEKGIDIKQGYIPTATKTAVRIRIKGDEAFLTVKGENRGAIRSEFEYAIPLDDAREILDELCEGKLVEKIRYEIPLGDHLWEVDVFKGSNRGLCIAEVELQSANELVELPDWIIEEVTGDPEYYNASLVDYPFCEWDKNK